MLIVRLNRENECTQEAYYGVLALSDKQNF